MRWNHAGKDAFENDVCKAKVSDGSRLAHVLSLLSLLLGVGLSQPDWWPKLLVIALFVLLTNPIGSSTLARAFRNAGVPVARAGSAPDRKGGET